MARQARYRTEKTDKSITQKILIGALGVAATGGVVYFGRKWYLKSRANKEQTKTFEDGTPATIAKQLKMAFENDGWWGTNVPAVREALRQIPSKEVFDQVAASYKNLFGSNLMADLSSELQSSEYNEMMNIIGGKPATIKKATPKKKTAKVSAKTNTKPLPPAYPFPSWVKRLKAAFDKTYGPLPGTDDNAIKSVFEEIPTQAVFARMAAEYQRQYGNKFLDDLKSESEFGQYKEYILLISKKPKT